MCIEIFLGLIPQCRFSWIVCKPNVTMYILLLFATWRYPSSLGYYFSLMMGVRPVQLVPDSKRSWEQSGSVPHPPSIAGFRHRRSSPTNVCLQRQSTNLHIQSRSPHLPGPIGCCRPAQRPPRLRDRPKLGVHPPFDGTPNPWDPRPLFQVRPPGLCAPSLVRSSRPTRTDQVGNSRRKRVWTAPRRGLVSTPVQRAKVRKGRSGERAGVRERGG